MFVTVEQYQFIYQQECFKYLAKDVFDTLIKEISFRKIPKNQILFFEGDLRDKLLFLQKGYVRIEQYDKTDSFSYVDFIKRNTLFPYGGMFQDDVYHYSAIAVTDIECFYISVRGYEQACLLSVLQMQHISQKLSRILRFHELKLRNMVTSSASDRVVQSLAILLKDLCCDGENVLPIPLTTLEIAKISATTRETVSVVLKHLRDTKKISYQHKKMTYLDKRYFFGFLE